MISTPDSATTASYELEVLITASRERVWSALAEETNAWWLPDFHMVGEGSEVRLDPRAGGHLIETREDGASLLWCTVHMCTPGESLYFVGHSFPQWGGPSTSLMHISLEETGEGTVLRLSDSQFGRVREEALREMHQGWTRLLTDGLKSYCEA